MFHLVSPLWLFGLLAMPLLALIHWQTVQRERDALEDFASESALAKMDVRPGADLRLARGLLSLGALACLLIALAQPRWGTPTFDGIQAADGSLVIVLDTSKSMRVQDVHETSRFKAAQAVLDALLPRLAGWRVGVVAFAGEAEPVCPLTTDHEAVRTLLARARPGTLSGKGSDIEAGLKAAVPLFRLPGKRIVLLMSDGEELGGDANAAVARVKEVRATVQALGFGSAQGGWIPGDPDVWGNPTELTFRGEKVVSKLDASALTRIADATGGAYIDGGDPRAVEAIVARIGAGSGAATAVTAAAAAAQGSQPFELFQLPLGLAILLVLLEAGLSLAGRPRPTVKFADALRNSLRRPAAVALLLGLAAHGTGGWTWYPTWLPNSEAAEAYQRGNLPKAEGLLRAAIAHDPQNFRLKYNLGNVLYERGNFDEAAKVYQDALKGSDADAKPVVRYNLGNAQFRRAEKANDSKLYERAIADYEAVLATKPGDVDAKHNLEIAKQRLKHNENPNAKPQGQSGSSGGQGSQGQGGPTPVGVQTRYKPPPAMKNLPSQSEVDALLRALESDERQRQAEQAMEPQPGQNGGLPDAQQMLDEALGSFDLQKDW